VAVPVVRAGPVLTLLVLVVPVAVAGCCSVMVARVVTVVGRSCRLRRPVRAAMVAVPGCCRCGVPVALVVPAVRVRPGWPEARRRIR
jgi:hypothetical protein